MRHFYRRAIAGALLLLIAACSPSAAPVVAPVAMEDTMALELFRLEQRGRAFPPQAESRLRALLGDAYASLGPDPRPPENADEFLLFAEKISVSLAAHNNIQPVDRADWVESLGEALQPIPADHPGLPANLGHISNRERGKHSKPGDPFYFLDCDIASLLLISVAQMVGFDLKLVEVPRHNFVRWSDGEGGYANWDWTNWTSRRDEYYARTWPMTQVQRNRGRWLASQSAAESRGYYVGVLAGAVRDPEQRLQLVREAIKGAPNNPIVAETAAWVFATAGEGVTDQERSDSVTYALSALAADPDNAGYTLTAACAYTVNGSTEVGAALTERAASLEPSNVSENFRVNLENMKRGDLCRGRTSSTDPDSEEE